MLPIKSQIRMQPGCILACIPNYFRLLFVTRPLEASDHEAEKIDVDRRWHRLSLPHPLEAFELVQGAIEGAFQ